MDCTRGSNARFGSGWATIGLTATLTAVLALSATLVAPVASASPATGSAPAGSVIRKQDRPATRIKPTMPHAAAAAAALARARTSGRPVVVAPDTTPTSETTANPDGTFTSKISALPVRVRQHGAWVPASAQLVRVPGGLSPAAAAEPVTLSTGGTGSLAVLHGPHGQNLTIGFPARLPAPVVSGATATYRSVRPGIDLRLAATTTGGITQTLLVRTRAAAKSRWLRRFTERYVATTGLKLHAGQAGSVAVTGPAGPVFEAAPPAVTVTAATRRPTGPGASEPDQPASTGRVTVNGTKVTDLLPARVAGRPLSIEVAITPAGVGQATTRSTTGMTADAFPSPSTIKPTGYVEAQDVQGSGGCQTVTNWNSTTETKLGIGFEAWNSCIGVYQTYYVFDTSAISNAWTILHMELNLTEVEGSWNACGGTAGVTQEPVYLHSLGASAGIGAGTDGSNVATLGTSSMVDNIWPAANPATTDNCANQPADFDVSSLSGGIQGSKAWTFGVNGNDTDNTSAGQFMRLSDNPTLVTTFDESPAAPAMTQSSPPMLDNPGTTDPSSGCTAGAQIPWIGAAASIQLNANFTAPLSGEETEPGWKVWNASSTLVNQTNANTSPGSFPYTISLPVDGDEYRAHIWTTVNGNGGQDGFDPGETTQGPTCTFVADQTPPAMPAVTSTAFPAAGSASGTTQTAPGASGTFAFSAADPAPFGCTASSPIAAGGTTCLASGVYEFEYSLNQPLAAASVTPVTTTCPAGGVTSGATAAVNPTGNPATSATANPSATSTATSCPLNVSQWGTNILYVAAVDTAGNISQSYAYEFYVPWNPATKPAVGDVNGDAEPDLLATDASGDLVLFPGGTDPAKGPVIASTPGDSPDGNTWADFIVTHRGSWSAGATDDLLALDTTAGNLYRYNNSWNTGIWPAGTAAAPGSPMYEATQDVVTEFYPSCTALAAGQGGAGSANCTGYPAQTSGWKAFTQIIAPGDAWTGAPSGSGITSNTGQPSLLGVASNGSLWLFQGSGGQLTNPVQLGFSDWNNVSVMAAGTVNGVNTIWARVNSGTDAGDVLSYSLTVPAGQVPTLNAAAPATLPTATSGTILVNSSGAAIQLPAATFPTVTATGPLSGTACTSGATDTSGCPGFFAQDTSGDEFYYAGRPTTTAAAALTGSRELVGDIGGQDSNVPPSTGTVQNASFPGDYCVLTNVQNKGGGWRLNPDGTMGGFYLNEATVLSLGSQVECWFANGMHEKLVLQSSDGNLVFYQYDSALTWGAATAGQSATSASFQGDGNFVVYTANASALWASGTHTFRNAILEIQTDGNLVIYQFPASGSPALWSTKTVDPALG